MNNSYVKGKKESYQEKALRWKMFGTFDTETKPVWLEQSE